MKKTRKSLRLYIWVQGSRLDLKISAMVMAAEPQFHVLAVDDSLFDRKLIERLLQKASCQGKKCLCSL